MRTYQQCQLSLLREEILQKKSDIRVLLKEFEFLHSTLQAGVNFIDFAHLHSLFIGHNDKVLKQKSIIQQKKLNYLLKDKKPQHDPEKVIFNCSTYTLLEAEKSLLQKGLNFSILPKKVNHADYLVKFELFYRGIHNLQVLSTEDLDFIKTKTKDIALSSFRTYNNNVPQHLSKGEFDALKNLSQNKQIVIQKSDKGNSIVIVDRVKYIEKMENFLSDQSKFQKIALKDDNFLNFITSQEKRIDKICKKLVDSNSMSDETRKQLKPVGTRPGIMYGSCKVHNKHVDGCPPFRPPLSALQTATYNLANYLVPILEPLTNNKNTVIDSFNFATEIVEQDSSNLMGSLDIDSLFTSIPLEETIESCNNNLFKNSDIDQGFKKVNLEIFYL